MKAATFVDHSLCNCFLELFLQAIGVYLVTFSDFKKDSEGSDFGGPKFDDVYLCFQFKLLRYFLCRDVLPPQVSLVYSARLQCFLSRAKPFTMTQICCSLCYFQGILNCFAFRLTVIVRGDKTYLATFTSFSSLQNPLNYLILSLIFQKGFWSEWSKCCCS